MAKLDERDRAVLTFERQWWKYAGAKETVIRDLFDLSATRYFQLLGSLIDRPEALQHRRRLPVPDAVTRALSQVLEERPDADVFFLTPRSGRLWQRSHFNDTVWKPTLEAAKLPRELGFHVLRHTYASHLIAAGLHPRVIQARMGHASIVETDTYGHLFPDGDDATRVALEDLLADPSSDRGRVGGQ
ncbi:MAG: hypothetical protein JWP66_1045 [Naasia sp.]|nr:hypothetical protein [Naasia sp.]